MVVPCWLSTSLRVLAPRQRYVSRQMLSLLMHRRGLLLIDTAVTDGLTIRYNVFLFQSLGLEQVYPSKHCIIDDDRRTMERMCD